MASLDEESAHKNAVVIQSSYRGYKVRQNFQSSQNEVPNVMEESTVASEAEESVEVGGSADTALNERATVIQTHYRGYKVRREQAAKVSDVDNNNSKDDNGDSDGMMESDLNKRAVVIQSAYRSYVTRRGLKEGAEGTGGDRGVGEGLEVVEEETREEVEAAAAVVSSEGDEGEDGGEQVLQEKAVIIQRTYRGYSVRRGLKQKQEEKRERQELDSRATVIQSAYRGYVDRRSYTQRREQLTQVEGQLEHQEGEGEYYDVDGKDTYATYVQTGIRGHVVRREHEQVVESYQESAVVIQSTYRGYRVRRQLQESSHATHIHASVRAHQTRQKLLFSFQLLFSELQSFKFFKRSARLNFEY